jgi:hypothetical protein
LEDFLRRPTINFAQAYLSTLKEKKVELVNQAKKTIDERIRREQHLSKGKMAKK